MTAAAHTRPRLERQELVDRLARLREPMERHGVQAALAHGTSFMPGDVQYLTGYDPQLESAAVLITAKRMIGLGGPEGQAMFADQALLGDWRNLSAFKIPGQTYDLRFWTLTEVLEETLGAIPASVAALSEPNIVPWEAVRGLTDAGVELRDASWILRELRYRKSPVELELYRTASGIATDAMRAMLAEVGPDVCELDVAAAADAAVKRGGAYATGFDAIVCSGPRIDTIIGRASPRIIRDGDLVMLGVSPRYEGYASALGRTVVAGRPTSEQDAFLDRGAEALELAAQALVPGRPARQVDLAARSHLEGHGLGRFHIYGVGHGIGLSECLEDRTATAVSDYELPTGIAMMLDVGLFGHPEFHGARHEDPFLIDHDGHVERLTDLPVRV